MDYSITEITISNVKKLYFSDVYTVLLFQNSKIIYPAKFLKPTDVPWINEQGRDGGIKNNEA